MSGTLYAASQKVLHKRAQDGPHANWTVAWDPMKDTARLDTYAVGRESLEHRLDSPRRVPGITRQSKRETS